MDRFRFLWNLSLSSASNYSAKICIARYSCEYWSIFVYCFVFIVVFCFPNSTECDQEERGMTVMLNYKISFHYKIKSICCCRICKRANVGSIEHECHAIEWLTRCDYVLREQPILSNLMRNWKGIDGRFQIVTKKNRKKIYIEKIQCHPHKSMMNRIEKNINFFAILSCIDLIPFDYFLSQLEQNSPESRDGFIVV